jgi:hypothetical protein
LILEAFPGIKGIPDYYQILITAGFTIFVWMTVMFLTPPEPEEKLLAFFQKIRPGGPGWKPIHAKVPHVNTDSHLAILVLVAVIAAGMVYLVLFGVGQIIFGFITSGIVSLGAACVCAAIVYAALNKIGWQQITH